MNEHCNTPSRQSETAANFASSSPWTGVLTGGVSPSVLLTSAVGFGWLFVAGVQVRLCSLAWPEFVFQFLTICACALTGRSFGAGAR